MINLYNNFLKRKKKVIIMIKKNEKINVKKYDNAIRISGCLFHEIILHIWKSHYREYYS